MTGHLIDVVGPSGAGKDSLMQWLLAHWPQVEGWPPLRVVRRTVTRCDPSGSAFDEGVSEAQFDRLQSRGLFGLSWQANGLCCGIRCSELMLIKRGACVFINGPQCRPGWRETPRWRR